MENSSKNNLLKQIKRYQNCISSVDPPENDEPRVLHYIRKLAKLPIKLEELEETGVGKTINALRKRNGNIAEAAALLVAKWKSIVKKQVEEEDEENEAEEKSSKRKLKRDHQSNHNYSPKTDSLVNDEGRELKQERESKESGTKGKVHLITIKHRNSGENKRKCVEVEQTNNVEKKKFRRTEEQESYVSSSDEVKLRRDDVDMSLNKTDKESSHSEDVDIDSNRTKRKRSNEGKQHKRVHEKRHHKSKKHNHKDEKHRRSKSTHHEKKDVEEDARSLHKGSDKNLKSRSKFESRKHDTKGYESSKKYSGTESNIIEKQSTSFNVDVEDCMGAGDNFGAALLSIPHASSPNKKRSISSKSSVYQDSLHSLSPQKSVTDFDLFSHNNMKLEPLDLDDCLKNQDDFYLTVNECPQSKPQPQQTKAEADMLNSMVVTKNQRTKVYSGNKCVNLKFPSLFELCARVLQENFDALEYTGGVPYDVLKPILEKVSVQQLYTFENFNPYLIGETDELWEYHAKKEFRRAGRMEYESWRDLYLRCVEEREEKLQCLTENISQSIANSAPVRKTKLAYIDTVVKPPRNVVRSQVKHGTGNLNLRSPKGLQSSPSAVQSVKERLAKESMSPNAIQIPSKSNLLVKKKKAPLMQKTLQLFKGLKR